MDNVYDFGLTDERDVLFRVKQNEIAFMKCRGYKISDEDLTMLEATRLDDILFQKALFVQNIKKKMRKTNNPNFRDMMTKDYVGKYPIESITRICYIDVREENKTKSDDIMYHIKNAKDDDIDDLIFITRSVPKDATLLDNISKLPGITIKFIKESRFYVSPQSHQMKIIYEPLSKKDAKLFLEITQIDPTKMPRHTMEDPLVIMNNWKRGTIVRYIRKSDNRELCDHQYYYRIV